MRQDNRFLFTVSFATAGTYTRNSTTVCDRSNFKCNSGDCILEDKLCDGTEDCPDGSDETRDCVNIIPCSSHFLFQCDYGACISKRYQCDGTINCKDGSDESQIACGKCGKRRFKCGTGECIDESFLCDGVGDCNDHSDETVKECSSTRCPAYSFRCDYGACIMKRLRCDGINDCVDGSDERSCSVPSSSARLGKFRCESGENVSDHRICDGIGDCRDNSDETGKLCGEFNCPLYTYRCKYGACVHRNARCNGIVDCVDASDENGCYTGMVEPNKPNNDVVKVDCQKDEFKCSSDKCVKEELVCDGKKHCDDGSEETFEVCAYRRCAAHLFTCNYGACVPANARCNGVNDCWDGSDEENCGTPQKAPLSPSSGCVVPTEPEFGAYELATSKLVPGSVAPPYSVLILKCNKGYGVTPPEQSFSVCVGEQWTPRLQTCTRTCPLIESTSPIECKFNNKLLASCDKAVHGSIALVQCNPITDGVVKSIVNFCRNGLWDSPINQCIPIMQNNSSNVNIFYIFNGDKSN
ncbi:hypothetical protein FQR65_LT00175 [Abscondita terminalis]|nr:hypothetical protein FQR65_LT00175 [Abscondita terminalis]